MMEFNALEGFEVPETEIRDIFQVIAQSPEPSAEGAYQQLTKSDLIQQLAMYQQSLMRLIGYTVWLRDKVEEAQEQRDELRDVMDRGGTGALAARTARRAREFEEAMQMIREIVGLTQGATSAAVVDAVRSLAERLRLARVTNAQCTRRLRLTLTELEELQPKLAGNG